MDAVLIVRVTLPDGGVLERTWTWEDVDLLADPGPYASPPAWLRNPLRSWQHPGDPLVLTGDVPAGHEADARRWMTP